MKNKTSILFILALVMQCFAAQQAFASNRPVKQQRHVTSFNKLKIYGGAKINLLPSKENEYGLEVIASTQMQKDVVDHLENDSLTIHIKPKSSSTNNNVVLNIRAPKLRYIALKGGHILKTYGSRLRTDELEIVSNGSSVADLDLDVNSLDVKLDGSNTFNLKGRADEQDYTISGFGTVDATKMLGSSADIIIKGSGNATVNVTDALDVEIKGSGTVKYMGAPVVEKIVKGFGVIKSINKT